MTGEATEVFGPIKVVFADANVLYSRVLRDYLVYAADEGVIAIRWSRAILTEAVEHLQANNVAFDDERREVGRHLALGRALCGRPDVDEPGEPGPHLPPGGSGIHAVQPRAGLFELGLDPDTDTRCGDARRRTHHCSERCSTPDGTSRPSTTSLCAIWSRRGE